MGRPGAGQGAWGGLAAGSGDGGGGGQVPLIQATDRFKGTQMGNVIFWLSIMLGQVPACPQLIAENRNAPGMLH